MAEVVLGIGTSHSPMLNATADEWTRFAPRDRRARLGRAESLLDRAIIDAFRSKDASALAALPVKKLNSGNSEIRNWIAAAGALDHLPLAWVEYVPAYRSPAGTGTGLCFAAWRG